MDGVKLSVKALCAYMDLSADQLAEKAGISANHLKALMAGRAQMTATDMLKLHEVTGISIDNIKTD